MTKGSLRVLNPVQCGVAGICKALAQTVSARLDRDAIHRLRVSVPHMYSFSRSDSCQQLMRKRSRAYSINFRSSLQYGAIRGNQPHMQSFPLV